MNERDMKDWTADLLADVSAHPQRPDEDFMARLLADALAAQDVQRQAVKPRHSWWPRWGGIGGLIAATICGVWLGFAPPEPLQDLLPIAESVAVEPYYMSEIYALLEE